MAEIAECFYLALRQATEHNSNALYRAAQIDRIYMYVYTFTYFWFMWHLDLALAACLACYLYQRAFELELNGPNNLIKAKDGRA